MQEAATLGVIFFGFFAIQQFLVLKVIGGMTPLVNCLNELRFI